MVRMLFAVVVLGLTGCTAASDDVTPTPDAGSVFPAPGDLPTPASTSKGRSITGTFGSDAIEGGCAYLEADDGTRYEVLYPEGWTVERGPIRLLDPDGRVLAQGGERITVRGRVTDDMASICQIGPIFSADEVVSIEP